MLVGLLPLLVVGPALIVVLAVRFADTAAPVRAATARATAVVQRSGLGEDGQEIQLTWTDDVDTTRTSTVRAARTTAVPAGTEVELRYRPADPGGPVFVGGDETSERLRDLAFGMLLTGLLVAAVVLASVVHVLRRLAAERRPGATLPVSYARSRLGIVRRSWLVVEEQGRTWWVPVHWEPVLPGLRAGTPVTVHGRPSRDRVVVVDVDGTEVWQAGRRREKPPRGDITRVGTPETDAEPAQAVRVAAAVPLARQFRSDSGLLAAAPILGLLWAYVDGSGRGGWVAASVVAAAVLVWLPTVAAADPT